MEVNALKACKIYLITVPIFFLIDLFWLGVLAKDFYKKHLGYLLRPNINWTSLSVSKGACTSPVTLPCRRTMTC